MLSTLAGAGFFAAISAAESEAGAALPCTSGDPGKGAGTGAGANRGAGACSSAVDRGGCSFISPGAAGVAAALGSDTWAGADAELGGARGVRNCGATKTPASIAAASVPNAAGRHHVRCLAGRVEPIPLGALLAVRSELGVRSAASRAA